MLQLKNLGLCYCYNEQHSVREFIEESFFDESIIWDGNGINEGILKSTVILIKNIFARKETLLGDPSLAKDLDKIK